MEMKAAILLALFAFAFASDVDGNYLSQMFQEIDDEGQLDEQDSIEQELEQNFIEQEEDNPVAIPPECEDSEVQHCLSFILALEDVNEDNACPAITSTYECLKEKSKACLDSEDQEEVKEGLDRIKDALVAHCGYEEEEEKPDLEKCIEKNKDDLVECIFQGLMETLVNYVKTEEEDTDKIKCTAYEAIANCQVEKIREKCSDNAADAFHSYLADMPEEIKNSCDSISEPQELFDVQLLQDKKK